MIMVLISKQQLLLFIVFFSMGKTSDLTEAKQAVVTALLENSNTSQHQIAKKSWHVTTISGLIEQEIKRNVPISSRRVGKCDRKKTITPRGMHQLKKIAMDSRRATNFVITEQFQPSGCPVPERKLWKSLYKLGFKCRGPIKKPKLTPLQRRMHSGNAHKRFTIAK